MLIRNLWTALFVGDSVNQVAAHLPNDAQTPKKNVKKQYNITTSTLNSAPSIILLLLIKENVVHKSSNMSRWKWHFGLFDKPKKSGGRRCGENVTTVQSFKNVFFFQNFDPFSKKKMKKGRIYRLSFLPFIQLLLMKMKYFPFIQNISHFEKKNKYGAIMHEGKWRKKHNFRLAL